MKDALKLLGLFVTGIFTAVIIYPLLHELGHCFVAVSVGAEVVDFNILPLPSVLCNVFNVKKGGIAAIGLGGILFPYLISFALRPKTFLGWYSNSVVRLVSLLALTISLVSIILWLGGTTLVNDDIIQVLNRLKKGSAVFFSLFLTLLIFGIFKIATDKPLRKLLRYFKL